MRKIQSILAVAAMTILTAFSARADWNATVEWETPGSVEIYAGGLNASCKVAVPASATKMDVHVEGSTAIYVTPTDGYVITGAQCADDHATINPIYLYAISKRGVSIQSYDHKGHTIKVDCVPLTMDAEIEVDLVNGREYTQCQFVETSRPITLHTGKQKIAYNKEHESSIEFSANAAFAVDPYIIHNGSKKTWSGSFGLLSDTFEVSDGDTFEVKYCDKDDAPEAPDVNITISYANEMARNALIMLYNVTQSCTLSVGNSFQAKEGDTVRFVFDTKEYDVTVNGKKVSPSEEASTSYNLTFDKDQTVTISASIRQWGETTVIVGVKSLEGLEFRRGTLDGEIISHSSLKYIGTESFRFKCIEPAQTVTVSKYEATVSLKDPKVFVNATDDCWIEVAETIIDGDHVPTGVAMPGAPLYVLNSKIVKDTRLVVFVGTDGVQAQGSDIVLRDHNRNIFELQEGYNEFMIDKAFSSPFTVAYHGNGSPNIDAYYNGSLCSLDDNEMPTFSVESEGIAHIFAGKKGAACSITAEFVDGADNSSEIVVDRIHRLTKDNPKANTFRTCEVSVTPGNNNYLLDGEAPEYEGKTHVFKARQNHLITMTKGDVPQPPKDVEYTSAVAKAENGVMVAEFTIVESLRVDLKADATAYVYNAEGELDQTIVYSKEADNMLGWNGLLSVNFTKPDKKGDYKLVVPADQFTIIDTLDGSEMPHKDFVAAFTVEEDTPVIPEDVEYSAQVSVAENGVWVADFTIVESLRVDLKKEAAAYIYNAEGELDQTVIYNAEAQNMLGWNGLLSVNFTKPDKKGEYKLVVPADEFVIINTIDGMEMPHKDFEVAFTVEEDTPVIPEDVEYTAEVTVAENGVWVADFTIVESLRVDLKAEAAAYIYNAEGELDQTIVYSKEADNMLGWNGLLSVNFTKPDKKGDYKLVVPADEFVIINTVDGMEMPHKDFEVAFTVEEDTPVIPEDVEYSTEVTVAENGVWVADFTIVESLRVDLKAEAAAYIYNAEGELDQTVIYNAEAQNMLGWNGLLSVNFTKPDKKGEYKLVVPADEFVIINTIDGMEMPHKDFEVAFTVEEDTPVVPEDVEYTAEVTVAENCVWVADFTIVESLRVDLKAEAAAYIYNAEGELNQTVIYNAEAQNMLGWNGLLSVNFTKPDKKGEYKLVVPADEFVIINTIDGMEMPHKDFEVAFTVEEDTPVVPEDVEYTAEVTVAENGVWVADFTIVESLRVDLKAEAAAYIYNAEGELDQTVIYNAETQNMLGWNGLLSVNFTKPDKKGEYKLVVPADEFVIINTLDGMEMPHKDFEVAFTVEEDTPQPPVEVEYTAVVETAENGTMYAEFTIVESLRVDLYPEATAYVYNAEGELDQTIIYNEETQNMMGWNGQLIVDFEKPMLKGEYTLVVPADQFAIFDTVTSAEIAHKDFEVAFTVEEDTPVPPVEVVYSAEVGTYPNGLMYAEFTIVESLRVDIEEDAEAYVLDAEGEVVQTIVYSEELQNMLGWNGQLIVDFIKPSKKGNYSLVVPADQFTVFDTVTSTEVEHNDFVAEFEILEDTPVEPIEVKYSVEIGAYPSISDDWYANFIIVESLRVDIAEGATAYVMSAEGEVVETIVYSEQAQNMMGWNGILTVDFTKPAVAGDYKVVVPADQFVIFDTITSTEVEHGDFVGEFKVDETTGINGIISADQTVTVVTLDGRVILSNAKAEQLQSLSTGVYIINGVKYLKH